MNTVHSILVAVTLAAPNHSMLENWQVWLTEFSGWRAPKGVYVDSNGRNVAYPELDGRDLIKDLRQQQPTMQCEKLPLTKYQVRKFAFRIASIPSDVLEAGMLIIEGSCFDEPRNGVTLKMNGNTYYFGYSQDKSCRNDQEVPGWLTSLVDALWLRYHEIEDCSTTPLESLSKP